MMLGLGLGLDMCGLVNITALHMRTTTSSSHLYTRLYMDMMYYVISFVMPLLLLSLFNAKLMMAYRQFRRKRRILRPTQLNARFASRLSDSSGETRILRLGPPKGPLEPRS